MRDLNFWMEKEAPEEEKRLRLSEFEKRLLYHLLSGTTKRGKKEDLILKAKSELSTHISFSTIERQFNNLLFIQKLVKNRAGSQYVYFAGDDELGKEILELIKKELYQ